MLQGAAREKLRGLGIAATGVLTILQRAAMESATEDLAVATAPPCLALAASAAASATKALRLAPTAENEELLERALLLAGQLHWERGVTAGGAHEGLTQRIRWAGWAPREPGEPRACSAAAALPACLLTSSPV